MALMECAQACAQIEHVDDTVFELVDFIGDKYGKDRAIVLRGIDIYERMLLPFGGDYNHQLMLSLIAPEEIMQMRAAALRYNESLLAHCAQHNVLIAMQGQDFCMNTGCILSPESLRKIYFPLMRQVNDAAKAHDMLPFFHCCGNTWDILDDYIAAGYEGYQSIQLSAGMDNEKLKQQYGNRLTLWTGVQCETLIQATPQQTQDEVQKSLETLMPGGGFLFGATNSVQFGASTENYLRAIETVRKYGVY